MREGVSGMLTRAAGERCPIFVFPAGTGNNFARDVGVSTVEDMFAVIDKGSVHPVDAVKVTHSEGSMYSINCITWGEDRTLTRVHGARPATRATRSIFTRIISRKKIFF